jgi:glycosyltransferase involved in cell wall biosynthesis
MKILMLAQFYAPVLGGEEQMVEALSISLSERGHQVAVATQRQPGLADEELRDGVRVYRLGGLAQRVGRLFSEDGRRHAPPAPDPETVLALRRVLARERPDVVHAHNWLTYAYLPLRRRNPAAHVLTLNDYSLVCATKRLMRKGDLCSGPGVLKCVACASGHYGLAIGPPVALLTMLGGRALAHEVDLFLPVSADVARRCGLAEAHLPHEILPNFRLDRGPPPGAGGSLLARLPDGPFILFVGDVSTDKGIGVLLEAHARMATRLPLVVIGRTGDPALVQECEDVIALGLLPHDAVLEAWSRCTIGVVPSIWPEPFGIVAIEAMAAGVPIVVSRIGGLRDIVIDGESGILAQPGDAADLAGALDRLAADPELRARLGAGARARVQEFSAAAVVPRYEQAYDRALATRSGAGAVR